MGYEEKPTYEHICSGTGCKYFVVWDIGYGDFYSCKKIGQSYHVDIIPDDCPFMDQMKAD